jgi:2'-5' RNA ligase
MKNVLKYSEFLINKEKPKGYEYGCAMIGFTFPALEEIHKCIMEEDIFTKEGENSYGLEKEPHVTLLYGLHSDEIEDEVVKEICMSHKYDNITLENVSLFENKEYDVLKFDVKGNSLHECNEKLSKLPHTTDYPNYHPHSTIAYLKSGTGKKYLETLKDSKHSIIPHEVLYSKPSGDKFKWKI